jgi:HAD superfamily hydrolase (TIGR01509 family)
MIKAVFFDFDGVLTLEARGSFALSQYLETKLNIDFRVILTALNRRHEEMLTGKLDYDDELNIISQEIGATVTSELLYQGMVAVTPNQAMFNLVSDLRARSVIVGIITNQSKIRIKKVRNEFMLDSKFDRIISSGDVGHTKKDIEIFQLAVDRLDVAPDEILFIENTESNLEIPKQLGWRTYFHDDAENDMDALQEFLKSFES